jgi:hypothetical protein
MFRGLHGFLRLIGGRGRAPMREERPALFAPQAGVAERVRGIFA